MTCLKEIISNQNYVLTKNGIKSKERWKILLHIKDTVQPVGRKKEGSQNQKSTKERRKWETKLIVTKTTGQTLCQVERTGRSESPRKSFW